MEIESAHCYVCPYCMRKRVVKLTCEERKALVQKMTCARFGQSYFLTLQYGSASAKNELVVGVPFAFTVSNDNIYQSEKEGINVVTEMYRGHITKGGIN